MRFSVITIFSALLLGSIGTIPALALPTSALAPRDDPSVDPSVSTTRPIKPDPYCYAKCSSIPDEVCAENKKKQQKTFVNACQLAHYNCLNPKGTYKVVHEGACDNVVLPIP
ncbi:hypothetical protein EC991_010237 [Linnemannia zychae]|nr:hypothetical protein EC991_010237 [Linnemannia zychae]